MKNKRLKLLMLLPMLVLGVVACDDSNGNIDYENKIIGKWQLVEEGPDGGSLKAVGNGVILEFSSNGEGIEVYSSEETSTERFSYTISSDFLCFYSILNDESINTYEYRFYGNKLETKLLSGAIEFTLPIVKRYKKMTP
ncbi:hypothetical protein D0T50_05280 [Bacteroides sp. 214]|uniref:hypothetical protein n=1 Tax=Bacteroides sp. 214 TaxID=2302935 RepID=UPI0013D6E4B3|nr:hypothetical protein [Bacteroides sp. 214]NDW12300.1 hypothetical protein [Bacteroides sp. 214]